MSDSNIEPIGGLTVDGLKVLGALLPGVGLARTPVIANGHVNLQKEDEENDHKTEEDEEEVDTSEGLEDPRVKFRITGVGGSESSSSGHVDTPIIRIQDEDADSEGSPLFLSKNSVKERRRQKELAGASLPPLLPQGNSLGSSSLSQQMRGTSAGPFQGDGKYGSFAVTIQDDSNRSRSPSPTRKTLRKTISGEEEFQIMVVLLLTVVFTYMMYNVPNFAIPQFVKTPPADVIIALPVLLTYVATYLFVARCS